jgi:hypothetical protein
MVPVVPTAAMVDLFVSIVPIFIPAAPTTVVGNTLYM